MSKQKLKFITVEQIKEVTPAVPEAFSRICSRCLKRYARADSRLCHECERAARRK